jgi:hypothetical protein
MQKEIGTTSIGLASVRDGWSNSSCCTMKKRKFRDLVTIKDALGTEWHVHEARQTNYGFDVLYGRKNNPGPYDVGGPCRLIYTNELKSFWEKYSLRLDGTIFDLPAGRTTLKRARLALGFNWGNDSKKFWRKHKSDLMGLWPREFAEKCKDKYKELEITAARVSDWRFRICGAKARPLGWWREPEVLKLLLSERTLNKVGAELGGISTSQVSRLRRQAKRAFEMRSGKLIQITEDCKVQEP